MNWELHAKRFEVPDPSIANWDAAIAESEPPERNLIQLQQYGMEVVRRLEDRAVNSSSLGWLSLWVKSFSLLDAARGAVQRRSVVSLRILVRTAFETELHALLVTEAGLDEVGERLSAYTAWCAWNDYQRWKVMAYPGSLIATYNPKVARDFATELGPDRKHWEKIFGPVEILSDQEAEHDRRRAAEAADRRIAELRAFLDQADLSPWVRRLNTLSPNGEPVFLSALFSNSVTTVGQKMRELKIGHAYPAVYGEGSLAVHSASFEQTVLIQPSQSSVVPRFVGTDDEMARFCETLITYVRGVLFRLQLILPRLPRGVEHGDVH